MTIIGFLNTVFWGYALVCGLIAVSIYFTIPASISPACPMTICSRMPSC